MTNIEFTDNVLDRFNWSPYIGRKLSEVFDELFDEYMGEDAFYDDNIVVGGRGIHDLSLDCIADIILRVVAKCGVQVPKGPVISTKDLIYYRHMVNAYYH